MHCPCAYSEKKQGQVTKVIRDHKSCVMDDAIERGGDLHRPGRRRASAQSLHPSPPLLPCARFGKRIGNGSRASERGWFKVRVWARQRPASRRCLTGRETQPKHLVHLTLCLCERQRVGRRRTTAVHRVRRTNRFTCHHQKETKGKAVSRQSNPRLHRYLKIKIK